jgi:hypothetical protein
VSRASDCEESFLCHCYSGQPADLRRVTDELDAQAEDLRVLTLDLYAQQSDRPEHIILVAYGEEAWWTCRLARAYYDLAMTRNCQVIAYSVQRRKEERPALGHEFPLGDQNSKNAKERAQANETNLRACRIDDLREHFAGPPEDMIGIALCVRGRHTWPLLQTEEGLHVWQRGDEKCRGLVHTSSGEMIEYQPPLRIDRKDGIGNQEVRRVYDKLRETIDDKQTGRQERFREEDLGRSILGLASDYLLARAKAWLQ